MTEVKLCLSCIIDKKDVENPEIHTCDECGKVRVCWTVKEN